MSSTNSAVASLCNEDPAAIEAAQHVPVSVLPSKEGDTASLISLTDLVAVSTLIVLGTVAPTSEIETYAVYNTPPNPGTSTPLGATHIYSVQVERVLKGNAPPSVKLFGEGGRIESPEPDRLPTQIADVVATAQAEQASILWQQNIDYLLFLRPSARLPSTTVCYYGLAYNPGSFVLGADGSVQVGPPGVIVSSFVVPSTRKDLLRQVDQAIQASSRTHNTSK